MQTISKLILAGSWKQAYERLRVEIYLIYIRKKSV